MRGCRFAGNGSPLKDLNGRKKVAFTHLHVHTEYSLLDASSKIKELTARAKELGMDSLAITDHGVMYGVKRGSSRSSAVRSMWRPDRVLTGRREAARIAIII